MRIHWHTALFIPLTVARGSFLRHFGACAGAGADGWPGGMFFTDGGFRPCYPDRSFQGVIPRSRTCTRLATNEHSGSDTAGLGSRLDLDYGLRGTRTRLINKRQLGPLTLQRSFYPEGDTCHNYILHPPGGVVGGDSLQINVHAGAGTHCLLTTPGATKFYRSGADRLAGQSHNIVVADGAVMEWLPQQNIFFPGANVALSTGIDIAPGGKFIGWEIHCLGRPASDETFSHGALHSKTRVTIAGELRLAENLDVCGEQALAAATGLRGLAMQASFLAAPCTAAQRDALEQILHASPARDYPHPIGLTLVEEVLVVRALGAQTEPLLQIFTLLWSELRNQWLEKSPCVPRIWAT